MLYGRVLDVFVFSVWQNNVSHRCLFVFRVFSQAFILLMLYHLDIFCPMSYLILFFLAPQCFDVVERVIIACPFSIGVPHLLQA